MANLNISDLVDAAALSDIDLFEVMQGGVNKKMTGAQLKASNTGASLGAVNVFVKNQSVLPVTLTSGATIATDASLSNNFKLVLATNGTLSDPTNMTDGMVLNFTIKQDATGGRTLAYGSKFDFGLAGVPVLSTGANKIDLISGYYDSDSDKILSSIRKAS